MIVLGVGQTGLVRLMAGERRPRPAGPPAPERAGQVDRLHALLDEGFIPAAERGAAAQA